MFLNISLKSKGKWQLVVLVASVIMLSACIFFMLGITKKIRSGDEVVCKFSDNLKIVVI